MPPLAEHRIVLPRSAPAADPPRNAAVSALIPRAKAVSAFLLDRSLESPPIPNVTYFFLCYIQRGKLPDALSLVVASFGRIVRFLPIFIELCRFSWYIW